MPRINIQDEYEYIKQIVDVIETWPGMTQKEISDETRLSMDYLTRLINNNKIPGLTYRRSKGGPKRKGRRIFYIGEPRARRKKR